MLKCSTCNKIIYDNNIKMNIYMAFDKMHCSIKCRNHTINYNKNNKFINLENIEEINYNYDCFSFLFN